MLQSYKIIVNYGLLIICILQDNFNHYTFSKVIKLLIYILYDITILDFNYI